MTRKIGQPTNVNDESTQPAGIVLNATTATKIADATPDPDHRIYFAVSNPSNKAVWIKFQAASVDNNKQGVLLFGRSNYEMPTNDKYIGEVSAIADSGTPTVYITEY